MTSHTDYETNSVLHFGSSGPVEARRDLRCRFSNFSHKTLIVTADEQLSLSTTLSVEHNDALFLGEVVGCDLQSGNTYLINIRVHQVLSGLQSLVNLRARLLGEPVDQPVRVSENRSTQLVGVR